MAASDLNYIIAVQLEQLDSLMALHDTIVAIKQLSQTGAEFNVRVNAQALTDLSNSISEAVSSGFSRGSAKARAQQPGRGGGGGGGGAAAGYTLEDLSTAIASALGRVPATGGGGGGSGGGGGQADEKKSLTQKQVQRLEDVARTLEDVISGTLKYTDDVRNKVAKQLGNRFERGLQDVRAIAEQDPARAMGIEDEVFDPQRIRSSVTSKLQQLRAREARERATTADVMRSGTGSDFGGGAKALALDVKVLDRAFESGAKLMAEAMRKSIEEATNGLAEAFLQVLTGGGARGSKGEVVYGEVTPEAFAQASTQLRTAGGTGRDLATLARQNQAATAALQTVRQEIQTQLAVLEKARQAVAVAEAKVLEKSTPDPVSGQVPRSTETKRSSLDAASATLAKAEQNAATQERKLQTLLEQQNVYSQVLANNAGQRFALTQYGPSLLSGKQYGEAQAEVASSPSGQRAHAIMRGSRALREMTLGGQALFHQGVAAGVFVTPNLPARLVGGSVLSSVAGLDEELSEKYEQRTTAFERYQKAGPEDKLRQSTPLREIQRVIEDLQRQREDAVYAGVNRTIGVSAGQYRARLDEQHGAGQISTPEYRHKLAALTLGAQRIDTLRGQNPEIERQALLIPQVLAQYIKDVLGRYVAALKGMVENKTPIPQELLAELRGNDLLAAVAGRTVRSPDEAKGRLGEVLGFLRGFTGDKTAFELSRGRGGPGIPQFNPNLDIATAPFLEEDGQLDVRPMASREGRERQLGAFFAAGGAFAPQTEERRAYALARLGEYKKWEDEGKELTPAFAKSKFEYERELEFGGRYYYVGQAPHDVVGNALLSPGLRRRGEQVLESEKSRVLKGGVQSSLIGPVMGQISEGMTVENKAAQGFLKTMNDVEGSLARINKTLHQFASVSFDPIIAEMKRLGEALQPYAAALAKVQSAVASSGALQGQVSKVALAKELARVREEEKTAGARARLAIQGAESRKYPDIDEAYALPALSGAFPAAAQSQRMRGDLARAYERLGAVPNREADPAGYMVQLRNFATNAKTMGLENPAALPERDMARLAAAGSGVLKTSERVERQRARIERLTGLEEEIAWLENRRVGSGQQPLSEVGKLKERKAQREHLLRGLGGVDDVRAELKQMEAVLEGKQARLGRLATRGVSSEYVPITDAVLGAAPQTIPPLGTDPQLLRELVIRGRGQLGTTQFRIQDLMSLYNAQLGAQMPTSGTQRQIGTATTQYEALMGTYATNVQALAGHDPRFFGARSAEAMEVARGVVGATNMRAELGESLRFLTEAAEKRAKIAAELQGLGDPEDARGKKRRESLLGRQALFDKATGSEFSRLQDRGLLKHTDAKTIDVVASKYGAVNGELQKMFDLLLQVTGASVEASKAGGSFGDRVISKFQNLAAYVTAGGVVYQVASQLRMAMSQTIGMEADLANIRGVLNTRSAMEAQYIGAGIMDAATKYGVPLRQSLQAGKLFAQTGVSPEQTVSLTQASLAAQVGANIEAGQATEMLIAVENITQRQVTEFDILDRISRIEAQYAVTAQDLARAIQRAGSLATQLQAQSLGSADALDLVIGAATTIIERTRVTGDQAATSLRFIISRLAAPEVARALQSRFGIRLAGDTPNQLRPLQDILGEIASTYNNLRREGNTIQAQQLLATFAGARQANVAAALLGGFDEAIKTAAESSLAYGDTQERVRLQLETLQAKLAQFNTSFVAFAASLFNNGGSLLAKGVVDLSSGVLRASATPGGAALAAGGAFALKSAAAAGGEGLSDWAKTRTFVGVGAGTRTALASGGARLLGWTAGAAGPIGAGLAAASVLQFAGARYRDIADVRRVRTATPFDQEAFRESPFFKEYQGRAVSYGFNTEQLYAIARGVGVSVTNAVDKEILQGELKPDKRYNRTVELFVEVFDKLLPGFAALGDDATRAAEALSILRDSAKFGFAVPQHIIDGVRADLADVYASAETIGVNLGSMLRDARPARAVRYGGEGARSADAASALMNLPTTSDSSHLLGPLNALFRVRNANMVDFSRISLPGQFNGVSDLSFQKIVENRGSSSEIQALDQYARANLFLQEGDLAVLRAAEARILKKRADSSNKVITAEERLAETLAGLKNATDTQIASIRGANTRYENQLNIGGQLADQLEASLGIGNRLVGAGLLPNGEDGEVFAAAMRQAAALAKEEVERRVRDKALSESHGDLLIKTLDKIAGADTRSAQAANLMSVHGSVRDRLFDPIVQYAGRMTEVRAQREMSERFGTSYDHVQESAAAGQQLVVGLQQVPIKLLQDQIRAAAKFVGAKGMTEGVRNLALGVTDDELSPAGLSGTAAFSTAMDLSAGSLGERQTAIANIKGIREQLLVAEREGFAAFIAEGKRAGGDIGEIAAQLEEALQKLVDLGTPEVGKNITAVIETIGGIKEIVVTALDVVGQTNIAPLIARNRRLADISRSGETSRLEVQLAGTLRQAEMQTQLASFEAGPRTAQRALDVQLAMLDSQMRTRTAGAQAVLDTTLQRLAEMPLDAKSKSDETDARAAYAREVRAAEVERMTGSYSMLGQRDAQLARRRQEEALQLVQDMTNPLREFLSSSKNMSKEGVGRFVEGMAQSSQQHLVNMAMRRVFSEAGILGDTLTSAFRAGALTTETAIESGFRKGVTQALVDLRQGMGVTSAGRGGAGMAIGGGALGAAAAGGAVFGSGVWSGTEDTYGKIPSAFRASGSPVRMLPFGPRLRPSPGNQPKQPGWFSKDFSFTQKTGTSLGTLADVGLPLLGSLVGGNLFNPNKTYSGEGSSVGAMLGTAAFGPVGGLAGGLLGGLLGGLKKRETEDQQISALERIERNTRQQVEAVENQTRMLTLDSRMMNVPTGFAVPSFRPFGAGGVTNSVNIVVNAAPGQSEEVIAKQVADALRSELQMVGSSYDMRRI